MPKDKHHLIFVLILGEKLLIMKKTLWILFFSSLLFVGCKPVYMSCQSHPPERLSKGDFASKKEKEDFESFFFTFHKRWNINRITQAQNLFILIDGTTASSTITAFPKESIVANTFKQECEYVLSQKKFSFMRDKKILLSFAVQVYSDKNEVVQPSYRNYKKLLHRITKKEHNDNLVVRHFCTVSPGTKTFD